MATTATTAVLIVAVECAYDLADGRRMREMLLVPMAMDPLYGEAVVTMRAERLAARQIGRRARGQVHTRVHASVPVDTMTPGASAPELVIDERPMIGAPTPYTSHEVH